MAGTGPLARNVEQFAALVAACDVFQTWVDADDAVEAAGSVYIGEAPGDAAWPLVVVDSALNSGLRGERVGANGPIKWGGSFEMMVEGGFDTGEEADSLEVQKVAFYSVVGDLLKEMMLLSATQAGWPILNTCNLVFGPVLMNDEGREVRPGDRDAGVGSYWFAQVVFEWGVV